MALTQRLFTEALRDMQRAMAVFDQPLFAPFLNNDSDSNFSNISFGCHAATDMIEKPEFYELQVEIPGYDKKDIKIEVSDSQQDKDQKQQTTEVTQHNSPKWWLNERVVGSFTRSFNFPNPIDAEQIKASCQDGILKLIIPKGNKNQSRLINIE
ncbi:HSP20-like chaperone [Gilbertella persicaria]|uniref:HSP20-like chaperone n=1 Tax=Gilbertella persicaria TaxID=101096 RepID=UPI00221F4E88|nr:HSP20-like chaperone [Gilbertella persicaria]KAI8077224.1 HSP20-like chaperone [Gilbertella persicaria]